MPWRTHFSIIPSQKLIRHTNPLNREHGVAMIAEKAEAIALIDRSLEKLEKIGTRLGNTKYGLWKKNLLIQRNFACLFRGFIELTVYNAFLNTNLGEKGDTEKMNACLKELLAVLERLELPEYTLYNTVFEFIPARKETYVSTFQAMIAECRRAISLHGMR